MGKTSEILKDRNEYKYGFYTDIETVGFGKGLNESIIRKISDRKKEPKWLLNYRLKAFEYWQTLKEPEWADINYDPIDFQSISYYAEPKSRSESEAPKSLDDLDPELIKTFEKLGIPLSEQKRISGVAVDVVFDSVSVGITHTEETQKIRGDFLFHFRSRS